MSSGFTGEPVGQVLPGPAHIQGSEVSQSDPQYTNIIQQMRQHGDLSTIGGTDHSFARAGAGNLNDASFGQNTQSSNYESAPAATYSAPPMEPVQAAPVQTYTAPPVEHVQAAPIPVTTAPMTSSGFGHSDDYKGFQQSTETPHPHGNAAQEMMAHHGGAEKDMFGRRKSSVTPQFSEPSDGRRTSVSGYQQYHPSSFTRTDDLGYTTNPLGGSDIQETSTGGAKMVAGRGYLVTGDTGAEGLTSAPLGDFTESGPGGQQETEGSGLKSRIAGLVGRAEERKDGTLLHSRGI